MTAASLQAALKGCSTCTYEEADGTLQKHCSSCQERVTSLAYEVYVLGHGGFSNGLSKAEEEMLVISAEEGSELTKACTKILRHGRDRTNSDGISNLDALLEEAADVLACIALLCHNGMIERDELNQHARDKLTLLKLGTNRIHHITPDMIP